MDLECPGHVSWQVVDVSNCFRHLNQLRSYDSSRLMMEDDSATFLYKQIDNF